MKVLNVNAVCGYGSTGRTCVELSKGLTEKGHEAYIAYSQGTSNYTYSFKFGNTLEQKVHALLSRVTGLQGYFSPIGTLELIWWIKKNKPDIVHLRTLHSNNVCIKQLLNFLGANRIPTVITLHDCWYFTGKCVYYTNVNCNKWESHCYRCPKLKMDNRSFLFDRTFKMFEDKRNAFSKIDKLAVIGVSDWITNEAKRSFLKHSKFIYKNYNWIDQSTFRPGFSDKIEKYKIPDSKFKILLVSAGWNIGTSKYNDFINLYKSVKNNAQIIIVGDVSHRAKIPVDVIYIPYVDDTTILAELYSYADVYIHLSTEDTFGKVIAEALACGTPAIVYNSSACPEILGEKCGYVVLPHDIEGIFKAIEEIKTNGKEYYTPYCVSHVKKNFNKNVLIEKTIGIYNDLINS